MNAKKRSKIHKVFLYTCLSSVIVFGLMSIVGSGTGSGDGDVWDLFDEAEGCFFGIGPDCPPPKPSTPDPPPDSASWGFGGIMLRYAPQLPLLCDEGGVYEDRVMVNLFLDAGLTILYESLDLRYVERYDTLFEETLPNEAYPFDLYVTVHIYEASVTCLPFEGPMDGMYSSSIFHTEIERGDYFSFATAHYHLYNTPYLHIDESYLWDWNNLPPLVELPY
ncbi:MAG: hypothetical protein GTN74_10745 [Proteobacteria bacterium]|nr:hypothetical protein [Pseudomonadota bacterium]NIS70657.1 hypothetical protein [Pseudomonadota bacterium]